MNWLKRLWHRLIGYGPCWVCQKPGTLCWVKESFKDPKNDRSWEFKGWLCPECFKAKTSKWHAMVEEFEREAFKGFR